MSGDISLMAIVRMHFHIYNNDKINIFEKQDLGLRHVKIVALSKYNPI